MGLEASPADDKKLMKELRALLKVYPTKQGALLPILHRLQERRTYLADEDLVLAGELAEMSAAAVFSVASFYTMFRRDKPGTHPLGVCRNIACWLTGAPQIVDTIRDVEGISHGETTGDGMFSLEEVECLGSCGSGPALEINGRYFENLTPDKTRQLLADLRSGECDPTERKGASK